MCKNIFQKIILGKTSANIIYKDQDVTAFYDINPIAPIHILIIPNLFIESINEITYENKYIIGNMIYIAVKIAKQLKIDDDGYRLIINCNQHGRQEIKHLHIHLLGGKKLNNIQ